MGLVHHKIYILVIHAMHVAMFQYLKFREHAQQEV